MRGVLPPLHTVRYRQACHCWLAITLPCLLLPCRYVARREHVLLAFFLCALLFQQATTNHIDSHVTQVRRGAQSVGSQLVACGRDAQGSHSAFPGPTPTADRAIALCERRLCVDHGGRPAAADAAVPPAAHPAPLLPGQRGRGPRLLRALPRAPAARALPGCAPAGDTAGVPAVAARWRG